MRNGGDLVPEPWFLISSEYTDVTVPVSVFVLALDMPAQLLLLDVLIDSECESPASGGHCLLMIESGLVCGSAAWLADNADGNWMILVGNRFLKSVNTSTKGIT